MEPLQLLLPAIATAALGSALLVPLRDDRHGRRATVSPGNVPFRQTFAPIGPTAGIANAGNATPSEAGAGNATPSDAGAGNATPSDAGAGNATPSDACAGNATPHDVPAESHASIVADDVTAESTDTQLSREELTNTITTVDSNDGPARDLSEASAILEPFAAIALLARPFAEFRSACSSFFSRGFAAPNPRNVDAGTNADPSAGLADDVVTDVVAERSFAGELSALLRGPASVEEAEPAIERGTGPTSKRDVTAPPVEHDVTAATLRRDVTSPTAKRDVAAPPLHDVTAPAPVREVTTRTVGCDVASVKAEVGVSETGTLPLEQNLIVAPLPIATNRIVPLTRLPLRTHSIAITWTEQVSEFAGEEPPSRAQRHAYLERSTRNGSLSSELLADAFDQEDGVGRTLALRAMLRHPKAGRNAFVEALRVGSDEERSLAVDGLAAIDARQELAAALADRVDAIAAKAALAYVGSLERDDYRSKLSPLIDDAQIETILKLLAGIVE